MKILFLSELGHTDKVPRDYRHMRTEFAQMCALQSDHLPITQIQNYQGDTDYLRIYAVNYNVLRIMSGMGGLAYSN